MNEPPSRTETSDQGPPLFKTWPRMYAFVVMFLALFIAALYLIGRHFS